MDWSLPGYRYDEIRSSAADFIEDWDITVYPLSLSKLLKRIGIRAIPYSQITEDRGELLSSRQTDGAAIFPSDHDPRKTIILYDDSASRKRTRFTIAHELGHIYLDHPDTGQSVYEHEADIFANYLLAPTHVILRDSELIAEVISEDFDVSYSCASSAMERAEKRVRFGQAQPLEYEIRILNCCHLMRARD